MDSADLNSRFQHHPPTGQIAAKHEQVRAACHQLAVLLDGQLWDGREKSLAITKLEEVMFWSNAALARQGTRSRV